MVPGGKKNGQRTVYKMQDQGLNYYNDEHDHVISHKRPSKQNRQKERL